MVGNNGVAVVTYGRKKTENKRDFLRCNSQKTWDLIVKKDKNGINVNNVVIESEEYGEKNEFASPKNVTKRSSGNNHTDLDSILSDMESLLISPEKSIFQDHLDAESKDILLDSAIAAKVVPSGQFEQKQRQWTLAFESKDLPSMEEAIQSFLEEDLEKVGEAAYSEVYANTRHTFVLKVIPVVLQAMEEDCPYMLLSNLVHEFWMTECISKAFTPYNEISCGFLKMLKFIWINFRADLCSGPYSKVLLDKWNFYEDLNGTENPSPSKFC